MAYLTYDEYSAYGGTLGAAAFYRHEFRARQFIDALTHGRTKGEQPQREAVQRAMVEIIDAQARDAAYDGREVQSVSNDGVAISYAATGAQARYAAIVYEYLANETTAAGVPLLYAGVDA